MFISKLTGGFYDPRVHVNMPPDVREISDTKFRFLLNGLASGKLLSWDDEGNPILVEPSNQESTEVEIFALYESHLDLYLDGVAQTYRYADRTRLALRAGYPNQHQSLAKAFGTWMDACNDIAKQCYLDVKAGQRAMPSLDDFLAMLPAWSEPQ